MHQFDVSVVLPAKNEAKNLSALLREIAEVVPSTTTEIIVVDDGSSDDSLSLMHNLSIALPVSCRVLVRDRKGDRLRIQCDFTEFYEIGKFFDNFGVKRS